jgi:uncharacterized membrane protein YjjP (DUF1212 family)
MLESKEYPPDDILRSATEGARLVLEFGGETYRAEEIAHRIAEAYGANDAECFATTTGAMLSIEDQKGNIHSAIRRIKRRHINLNALARVSKVAEEAERGEATPRQALTELAAISEAPGYPEPVMLIAAAILSSFFSLLFGGGLREALLAAPIGLLTQLTVSACSKRLEISDFFINVIGGFLIAFLARGATIFMPSLKTDTVIIGAIMLLVPGLAIVNAIRDIITGDLVAGTARGVEAFMTAAAISLGAVVALLLTAGALS